MGSCRGKPVGPDQALRPQSSKDAGRTIAANLTYAGEFEQITLAGVLLTRYTAGGDPSSLDEVARLLQRLLSAAEAGTRIGSVIEILVLQALALQAGGDLESALVPLDRALTLAEPERYVRVFVGEENR